MQASGKGSVYFGSKTKLQMLEIFCAKMDYYISGKILVHLIVIMLLQSLQKK